ncbi:MAG: CDP-diacylglycerol--glycerol-3-phosphate 3-phosphatidyltransferase [Legionellaceae bacterium]|nr:CDP-diacylglycerol--glycerol-3-phosphate 3-phosphatidyltransferase [Legionellaceae bacterium]
MKLLRTGLPNLFTLLRILLIPVFIIIFYLPFSSSHAVAAIIFAVASVTDWLDGFLARKLHQTSPFGAFLDPVADKLLVACSLLMLVGSCDLRYITIPAIVIVGREIVISALREWMAEIGKRASVAVGYVGKIKTFMQMLAIIILIAFHSSTSLWGIAGVILLYLSAIMTIWSMIAYLKIAWPELNKIK